jgi:hypothetical protein
LNSQTRYNKQKNCLSLSLALYGNGSEKLPLERLKGNGTMKNESWKFLKIGKRESKNERAMRY